MTAKRRLHFWHWSGRRRSPTACGDSQSYSSSSSCSGGFETTRDGGGVSGEDTRDCGAGVIGGATAAGRAGGFGADGAGLGGAGCALGAGASGLGITAG